MNVPFDIWYHIANFLPADHLKTLYPINHAFFDFGMNERYKTIDIGLTKHDSNPSRTLARLQSSPHLHRVRSLSLYSQNFFATISDPSTDDGKLQQAFITQTVPVSHIISNMPNVQELSIWGECWFNPGSSDDIMRFLQPVMATGWNTFGTTLRHLTLHLSVDESYHVLTPTLVFPALQKLEIVPMEECKIRDVSKLFSDLLVPFITNHHSTLEYLNLKLSRCGPLDVSGIAKMSCLPRLRTLEFHQPNEYGEEIDTSWLHHMLRIHSNGLRELILSFGSPRLLASLRLYAQPAFHLPMPHVESLDLVVGFVDVGLAGAYIQQFKALTTLSLESGLPLCCDEVGILVKAISACDMLRTLSLSVFQLTPQLLDLLATNLPNLDSLTLTCDRVRGCRYRKKLDKKQSFRQAMRGRLYSGWNLAHIYLSFTDTDSDPSQTLAELKAVIADTCPRMKLSDKTS